MGIVTELLVCCSLVCPIVVYFNIRGKLLGISIVPSFHGFYIKGRYSVDIQWLVKGYWEWNDEILVLFFNLKIINLTKKYFFFLMWGFFFLLESGCYFVNTKKKKKNLKKRKADMETISDLCVKIYVLHIFFELRLPYDFYN